MKPALIALALLALAACREDEAAAPPEPVTMTAEAVGHYCQMTVLDHPGPKAQIHLAGLPAPIFFSQVRDAVAYLRMPEQSHAVRAVFVSDMAAAADWENPGPDNWIAAGDAVFVVGSDRTGGMGAPEIVPFSTAEAARAFAAQYGGTPMSLDQIPDSAALAPVDQMVGQTAAPEHGAHGTHDDTGAEAEFRKRLDALGQERTN